MLHYFFLELAERWKGFSSTNDSINSRNNPAIGDTSPGGEK